MNCIRAIWPNQRIHLSQAGVKPFYMILGSGTPACAGDASAVRRQNATTTKYKTILNNSIINFARSKSIMLFIFTISIMFICIFLYIGIRLKSIDKSSPYLIVERLQYKLSYAVFLSHPFILYSLIYLQGRVLDTNIINLPFIQQIWARTFISSYLIKNIHRLIDCKKQRDSIKQIEETKNKWISKIILMVLEVFAPVPLHAFQEIGGN